MPGQDPISGVLAVSTGSVRIRPEYIGPPRKNVYLRLVTSRQWTVPLPINAYVIEHREGLCSSTPARTAGILASSLINGSIIRSTSAAWWLKLPLGAHC